MSGFKKLLLTSMNPNIESDARRCWIGQVFALHNIPFDVFRG